MLTFIIALLISYLLGSIPTAFLAGKFLKKIDIRQYGSGNVGATNAFRVLGKGPGTAVLLFDISKGVLAILLTKILGPFNILQTLSLGVAAVMGHNWTVFLQFKGGKGIATSLGVLIGLTLVSPGLRVVLLLCVFVWLATFLSTRYVSLASMLAAVVLPFSMALTNQPLEVVALGILFCVFVILRHRSNLRRLLEGQESRVNLRFFKKNPSKV